ncbi:MAG: hypothetical protein DWQ44_07805 [Bacteroidetes bacterium]|nr:MAG: hypothetical protein DWQ33_06995 [Bacteroidota bacterium]REJ99668.1 MAG: hypothetical protein DWQ39_12105 [Bacteroidota bacterium]REK33901.1 MAG: hypothetical protein DWQ44_07805 [Bacteroidota bacterium]REK47666.1 MAG: hypothetical protein DWQ48_11840 [Bacteroidota bacterium]
MCGIFGLVGRKGSELSLSLVKEITDELFVLSERRGKESSGIAVKNTRLGSISVYKQSIPASELIKSNQYRKFFRNSFLNGNSDAVSPFALIAHARLVTNGSQENNNNNQPVIKDEAVAVHNGIIVNVDDLWKKYSSIPREFEVDTEVLIALIRQKMREDKSMEASVREAFSEIYGAASIAMLNADTRNLLLATNTGSLYSCIDPENKLLIFSSEKFILESLINNLKLENKLGKLEIEWLKPGKAFLIDIITGERSDFDLTASGTLSTNSSHFPDLDTEADQIINHAPAETGLHEVHISSSEMGRLKSLMEFNLERISQLKRCSKCLLPETFPFIQYDHDGICNYCHHYTPIRFKGLDAMKEELRKHRKSNGNPDCIVTFSGGRDSCYGLHYMREEMGMTPIAYTYDWGMVTDLARRNQARLCGKLGIEHIVISADIKRKRSNIRKNVTAWLSKPHLGTIPLFMAGDKQYFYYANLLKKEYKTELVVLCENMLETTNFKSGFCGIAPPFYNKDKEHTYSLSAADKLKMMSFYGKEFITNPKYLNSSVLDTIHAFFSYYFMPHEYLNMFGYIEWDEKTVEDTLFKEYEWEVSPDTTTTWRIGDGTAAFYNYIYYTVAGFSEFDTFRSNQIREGQISRDEGMRLVNQENRPRFDSFLWYCQTIGLDFEGAVKKINSIPKLYS